MRLRKLLNNSDGWFLGEADSSPFTLKGDFGMLTIRQYLRTLDKRVLQKLFNMTKLTPEELQLVTYAFIDKHKVEKSCRMLNISKTKYHSTLNEALIKLEYQLITLDKLRTI